MPFLDNVVLTITDELTPSGAPTSRAIIKVECIVRGDQEDIDSGQRYTLNAEIIGVDKTPGEDYQDDPLPIKLRLFPPVGFKFTTLEPVTKQLRRLVSRDRLNEDLSFGHTGDDEIQAHVTLRQLARVITRDSNVVVLEREVIGN